MPFQPEQLELFNYLNERKLQLLGELRSVQLKLKEIEKSFRRCGECRQRKSVDDFHKSSWVCKPCKRKIDHEIYQYRKKAA